MKRERLKALSFLVIAAVLWSVGGILIKLVEWNPIAIAGTRSGISAVVMYFYIRYNKKNGNSKKLFKLNKLKLIGACIYATTVILFVIGNKLTTAANVILLQYTAPIWVVILSGWILKEKVKLVDGACIFFVMMGMIMFFIGDLGTGKMLGNFISVLSGVALAGVVIMLKLQKEGTAVEMIFLGNCITLIVSIPFVLKSVPSMQSIVGLVLLGVFQLGISYILFAEAVPKVSAIEAIIIPVIEPLLNPVWVFICAGERPGQLALMGGIIVVLSIIFRSILESRTNRKMVMEQSR
ncbi:DMT family transporter [Marinisporobacter balticus]|uniref:Drug/metabolite transporter (DMT)-like permease n=1 Tax=Marinisporobacter balticus TaxID=2018667 RepID=A0A4V6NPD1_9FIRM|nr:DMT family transporter [Marinisporobacter balticus]TCO74620.1 drug/metabolite transporter (DMT)-like permease [Marinisporobacter balticus]